MTLGIGVIGTGIMGADHVQTITAAISGAEVHAIADIDLQRAEMIASRVPGAKALQSAEGLIESPEVDGVIIASSDATHARYVSASIAARKPVLCEKPLAPTVAECEEILRLEQAAGFRLVQVGFMRRFDAGYVELRKRVASGLIGSPMVAHCVHRNVDVPASWTSETTVLSWNRARPTDCHSRARGRRSDHRRTLHEIRLRLRDSMRGCWQDRHHRAGTNRAGCCALWSESNPGLSSGLARALRRSLSA
jgi:hypothetical protein